MEQEGLWGIATIVGPIVLLILFAYVIMRNRSSKVSKQITEDATEANYQAEDAAAKKGDI